MQCPQSLTKATGAEIDTGTNNSKYVTAKALADSALGGAAVPYVNAAAPGGPSDGMLWWDIDDPASVPADQHAAVTVSAPLSVTGQALSLVNDAAATVTEIDTASVANSDTKIPTSKAVYDALAGKAATTAVITWSLITSDPAPAVKNNGYLCNTSGAAFTLTLPAAPAVGDWIAIADGASTFHTFNLTIGRAALKIMGLSEDMTVNVKDISFSLVYASAALGWRIAT
jgi:hypothetical protein